MSAPLLETPRLLLRPHRVSDLDACAAIWAAPLVTRFIGGRAATRQEAWFKMLRYSGLWQFLGYGYWAVEHKESGQFVGELGFADFRRALSPAVDGRPEVGWVLAPHVHGQGLATEALQAVLRWGDERFEESVCIIEPANAPSLRLAVKLGFERIGEATLGDAPVIRLHRNRG